MRKANICLREKGFKLHLMTTRNKEKVFPVPYHVTTTVLHLRTFSICILLVNLPVLEMLMTDGMCKSIYRCVCE